jgi:hypothetical protein
MFDMTAQIIEMYCDRRLEAIEAIVANCPAYSEHQQNKQ